MPCDEHKHLRKGNFSQYSGFRMCPPVDFTLPWCRISRNLKQKYRGTSVPEHQPLTRRTSVLSDYRINMPELNTDNDDDSDKCW